MRRRGPNYPQQYNIESQAPSQLIPYDPARQPDVEGFTELQRPHPLGYRPWGTFVVSTYEARPINALDFLSPFNFGTATRTGNGALHLPYIVPSGKTAIVRSWFVDGATLWEGIETPPPTQVPSVSALGGFGGVPTSDSNVPNGHLLMSFAINGTIVQDFGSKNIDEAYVGWIAGETYFVVPENQTFEMILTNGSGLAVSVFNAITHGNLLLTTDLAPEMQPGTQTKLPVTFKDVETLGPNQQR